MSPKDSEKLYLYNQIGKTRLILRNIVDTEKTNLSGASIELIN